MTKAVFNFKNENFISFELKGHANYSESGTDIVCSAITSSTFTTINLVDKLFKNKYELVQRENEGYVCLTINEDVKSELLNTIILNFVDMLKMIEEQYPQNIKVILNK